MRWPDIRATFRNRIRCSKSMDEHRVAQMIGEFRAELNRVEAAIQALESLPPAPKRKRGRPSMSEAERQEVSERMRRYWDERRRNG